MQQAAGVMRRARQVALGELGVEARVLADARERTVIRMGVVGVRHEEKVDRAKAQFAGQLVTRGERVLQPAVGPAQVHAPAAQDPRGLLGLPRPRGGIAEGRRFAVGRVDDGHGMALRHQQRDRAAHRQFRVVGMCRQHGDVHAAHPTGASRGSARSSGYWIQRRRSPTGGRVGPAWDRSFDARIAPMAVGSMRPRPTSTSVPAMIRTML